MEAKPFQKLAGRPFSESNTAKADRGKKMGVLDNLCSHLPLFGSDPRFELERTILDEPGVELVRILRSSKPPRFEEKKIVTRLRQDRRISRRRTFKIFFGEQQKFPRARYDKGL